MIEVHDARDELPLDRPPKGLRRYLRLDGAVPPERLSISGYWRLGVDDEGWRAGKRAWAEAIEAAAGLP